LSQEGRGSGNQLVLTTAFELSRGPLYLQLRNDQCPYNIWRSSWQQRRMSVEVLQKDQARKAKNRRQLVDNCFSAEVE
jgi:hypothetical protein